MNITPGRTFLSDPTVSPKGIIVPESPFREFFNPANLESRIRDATEYSLKTGDDRVIGSIIRYEKARFGHDIGEERIVQTVGATNAIDLSMAAILERGDTILIPTPSYFSFWKTAQHRGYNFKVFYSGEENNFLPSLEDMEKNLKPGIKAVGLIHPAFPTGFKMDRDRLIELIDFISSKKVFTILDLIYDFLTYNINDMMRVDAKLGACLERNKEHAVRINATSKIWSAPGIRFGYMVAPEGIALRVADRILSTVSRCPIILSDLYQMLMDGTSSMITDAASDFRQILARNLKEYQRRAEVISAKMSGKGVEVLKSDAGFNVFIKLNHVPNEYEAQWEFLDALYERSGVFLDYGFAFGVPHHPGVPTYARVNLGLSEDRLMWGIEKLAEFHSDYKKK